MIFHKTSLEGTKASEIAQCTMAEQKIMLAYTEVPRLNHLTISSMYKLSMHLRKAEVSGKAEGAP